MYKENDESRIERKKEKTRQNIITIAIDLFKTQGIEETTMERIANDADVSKRTLYKYFKSKEAIISDFIQRSFKGKNPERILRFRNEKNTRSRMIVVFNELIQGVREHKDIFEKYVVYRMQNMVSFYQDEGEKSGLYLLGLEIIRLGQESNEIRKDLPNYVVEDLFEFAFIEVVKQFYFEIDKFDQDLAIQQCVDIFIKAVKP